MTPLPLICLLWVNSDCKSLFMHVTWENNTSWSHAFSVIDSLEERYKLSLEMDSEFLNHVADTDRWMVKFVAWYFEALLISGVCIFSPVILYIDLFLQWRRSTKQRSKTQWNTVKCHFIPVFWHLKCFGGFPF